MFEQRVVVEADDAGSCADALVASLARERRAVAERFALVASWADLHDPGTDLPDLTPAAERERRWAGSRVAADGTPRVVPHAAVELGMLLQTSTGSAEALLRDVLELRHRLPEHWEAVLTGQLEGWKAREVAKLTHRLSCEQAQHLDALVIDATLGLPWGRARDVVEAKVIAADPTAHQARLAEEENRRFVSTRRRSTTAGLRTLIARGHAGDIARLEAMIAHLATLLAHHGDPDPADTRRAKALAMLANPALTCLYLAQTHDTTTTPGITTPDTADPADPAVETAEPVATVATTLPLALQEPAEDPDPEPEPEPVEEDPAAVSPVELAVTFGRLLHHLGSRAIDRLRPRSVLYLHLAAEAVQNHPGTGVARVEDPIAGGPIGLDQLRQWLTHDRITIKPVLDPTDAAPVDGYEVPTHLREALHLLTPYETFPYGTLPTRQADADHTTPYLATDHGGPPGQTGLHNLGPLARRHHLAKTFAGFTVHQPRPGTYLWRTPTGHRYKVDHRGTTYTGKTRPTTLDTHEHSEPEQRLRDLLLRHHAA